MTIRVNKLKDPMMFSCKDAESMGLEKAIIYWNIENFAGSPRIYLSCHFPFIEKKRFYLLLEELIDEGMLKDDGNDAMNV